MRTRSTRRAVRPRTRCASRILAGTLSLLAVLGGCGNRTESDLITPETFVQYYTALLRSQEKAGGDPDALRRFLELESLPDGWQDQMIAFAERKPLGAVEWAELIRQALARAAEPTDG